MIDLLALADFVLVATHSGVTQAARAANRPKASLSRRVMELEASLGVRLFERGSRSLRLTDEGRTLFARSAEALAAIAEVTEELRDGRAQPRGRLRVSVPAAFGQVLLGRLAAGFKAAYPEVDLEVAMDDRKVDLVEEGFDVVIRLDPKPDSALVGRRFARDRLIYVASPALPMSAEGQTVPVVMRSRMTKDTVWRLPGPDGRELHTRTVLELPTFPIVRDAILTGIGAAKLPRMLVAEELKSGRLVSWGDATEKADELWVLHPSSRLPSAKVEAFMAYMETAFPGEWL